MQDLVPYLKKGDLIGITCPAGAVDIKKIDAMCTKIISWGFKIRLGKTVGTNYFKYSAKDEDRRKDLQDMLDDKEIKAILFGRGGYGVVRIIDAIDFSQFIKQPKWLLGYSDITCLHSHIHSQYNIPTIHAQMSGGYISTEYDEASIASIYKALTGEKLLYEIPPHKMNRMGKCEGQLIGGNLALLSDLIGTSSDMDTTGKILFIEDVAEYKYNLDRMLWQLKRANKLSNLAGLIVGSFTDILDNEIPFGQTEYEIVWEKVKSYQYPVVFDFPVGHQSKNVALKLGLKYQLDNTDKVFLREL